MARSSTLLFTLSDALYRRPAWGRRSEIADALGVDQATLTPWLNYLEFFRALEEKAQGITAHEGRLLAVLTAYRQGNLRPERPTPIQGEVGDVHDALTAARVPHAFSMFTAANAWAFYEPHRDVHVYVPRGALRALHAATRPLRPTRTHLGGRLHVYLENLDNLPHQSRGGLPVTTPFVTTIDLRAHPEGGAHAAFLEENLLPRLRGRDS